ncbi:MAG: L-aspartate oxidase, partial [Microbacterium sp.]
RRAAAVLAAWRAAGRTPRTEAEFEDENLLVVADALVAAALARRESVGAHYRRDDPACRAQQDRAEPVAQPPEWPGAAASFRSSADPVTAGAAAC